MGKKWIQKANDKMEAKGTKGSFRAMAKKEGGLGSEEEEEETK